MTYEIIKKKPITYINVLGIYYMYNIYVLSSRHFKLQLYCIGIVCRAPALLYISEDYHPKAATDNLSNIVPLLIIYVNSFVIYFIVIAA